MDGDRSDAGATSALAVEVRRKSPFEDLTPSNEGVIVYRVDTTKGQGLGVFTIVSNPTKTINSQNFPEILGTMKPGESVSDSGYVISVLQTTTAGYLLGVLGSRFKLHRHIAEAVHQNRNPDRSAIDH